MLVIVITAILSTIAITQLGNQQATSKDSKRANDASTIAVNLENFYLKSQDYNLQADSYPYAGIMTNESLINQYLPDLNKSNMVAPDKSSNSIIIASSPANLISSGYVASELNNYIYQPLTSNDNLCTTSTQTCTHFNLYYFSQVKQAIYAINSKHQQ